MPRNGSGTFAFAASSVNPAVSGTEIDPAAFNALIQDLEDALTASIAKDGQTAATANLPMNGFRHSNVGAATARTMYAQAAQIQDGGLVYAAGSGTNTVTATLSPAITALATGMTVRIKAGSTNTGAATLNLNAIGAKSITRADGSALIAGDMVANGIYTLVYDGTSFILQNASAPQIAGLTEEETPADDDLVAIYDTSAGEVVSQTTRNLLATLVPAGLVLPFAGTTAPTGWLLCYGQEISRTTYADLFSAIGTTYGAGDASTTFNVPDMRGRVPAGKDDMGGSSANRLTDQSGGLDGDTLGDTGGSETHTLTTDEMPAHTHTITGVETSSNNTGSDPSSTNGSPSDDLETESTGGGSAHNNVQPTIILNYIIRT